MDWILDPTDQKFVVSECRVVAVMMVRAGVSGANMSPPNRDRTTRAVAKVMQRLRAMHTRSWVGVLGYRNCPLTALERTCQATRISRRPPTVRRQPAPAWT